MRLPRGLTLPVLHAGIATIRQRSISPVSVPTGCCGFHFSWNRQPEILIRLAGVDRALLGIDDTQTGYQPPNQMPIPCTIPTGKNVAAAIIRGR
jgi:hypothetical protein